MKPLFRVTTDEGEFFVRTTAEEINAAMYEYIKAKREQGVPLGAVKFVWLQVSFTTLRTVLAKAQKDLNNA